ncbi:MAG: universal stress protein [Candidatus Thermoplasmatota archaeon]|nr:universal stress protein [Candidatus Thermoplasmatota archaeon]
MAKKQAGEYNIRADYMTADSAGDLVSRIIYKIAKENAIDVIVTGTRRLKGLSKVILGSVSSELISISDIPVLTVPRTDD